MDLQLFYRWQLRLTIAGLEICSSVGASFTRDASLSRLETAPTSVAVVS